MTIPVDGFEGIRSMVEEKGDMETGKERVTSNLGSFCVHLGLERKEVISNFFGTDIYKGLSVLQRS